MEYPKKSAHGDASEYFLAYTVTHLFDWPCRLVYVSLGKSVRRQIARRELPQRPSLQARDHKSIGDIHAELIAAEATRRVARQARNQAVFLAL